MLHDNNGSSHLKTSENIIQFRPLPDKNNQKNSGPSHPPMINLPLFTKFMLGAIIGIHVIVSAISYLSPDLFDQIYFHGAFTPASWSGTFPFMWWTPLTVVSFSFLHGGWLHLAVNSVMLMAFGSGVEKWLGAKRMLIIFSVSSVIALLFQFASAPHSMAGVVGISGGISGFFGALLLMMQQQRALGNTRNSIMPFVIAWVAVSILFGYMGAPDGSPIAWLAHIGGFVGGLAVTWQMIGRPQIFPKK